MIRRMLLGVWVVFVATTSVAQPAFLVSVSSDKSHYLIGEPIRLSVLLVNTSGDTIYLPQGRRDYRRDVFMSVASAGVDTRYVATRDRLPWTRMCPGDSLQFFVQAALNQGLVDATGRPTRGRARRVVFEKAGEYAVRICCLAPEGGADSTLVATSNPLKLRIGKPPRADKRIIAALRDVHAIDDHELGQHDASIGTGDPGEAQRLQRLVAISRSSSLLPNLRMAEALAGNTSLSRVIALSRFHETSRTSSRKPWLKSLLSMRSRLPRLKDIGRS